MHRLTKLTSSHLAVIKSFFYSGTTSCLDISKVTGHSIPTTIKNINELVDAGYLSERDHAKSAGGRKPLQYALVPNCAFIMSVSMDQHCTQTAIFDMSGKCVMNLGLHALEIENPDAGSTLLRIINKGFAAFGVEKGLFCGIGLSMPGFINVTKGVNHRFLNKYPDGIRKFIFDQVNVPIYIDNDSTVIALAELKFGLGRQQSELMVINLNRGIGLGMIIEGKIFRGVNGFAGEFSHMPIFDNNKLCSCGKRGCLETEASLKIIEERVSKAIEEGYVTNIIKNDGKIAIDTIFEAANNGDSLAIKVISEAAAAVGRGIAMLVHILNPQSIVLSGKGTKGGKFWFAPIQQALNEYCIPILISDTNVVLSDIGINAQLIGTASLVVEQISVEHFPPFEKNLLALEAMTN